MSTTQTMSGLPGIYLQAIVDGASVQVHIQVSPCGESLYCAYACTLLARMGQGTPRLLCGYVLKIRSGRADEDYASLISRFSFYWWDPKCLELAVRIVRP